MVAAHLPAVTTSQPVPAYILVFKKGKMTLVVINQALLADSALHPAHPSPLDEKRIPAHLPSQAVTTSQPAPNPTASTKEGYDLNSNQDDSEKKEGEIFRVYMRKTFEHLIVSGIAEILKELISRFYQHFK